MFKNFNKILIATTLCFLFLSCGSDEGNSHNSVMEKMQFEAYFTHTKNLYQEGNNHFFKLKSEVGYLLATGPELNKLKIKKTRSFLAPMEEIESETDQLLTYIYQEKNKILAALGCKRILRSLGNRNNQPELIDGSVLKGNKEDAFHPKKLQKLMTEYRNFVVTKVANSPVSFAGNQWKQESPFDIKLLQKARLKREKSDIKVLRAALSTVNPDNQEGLVDLIYNITPSPDENKNYTAREALHYLCIQEGRILEARKMAFSLIGMRMSMDSYSFDKITNIAVGPDTVNQGDEVELQVMVVAYDSYNTPKVNCDQNANIEVREGISYVKLKVDQTTIVKGTIRIKNKAGHIKLRDWEKKIVVQ